jgi:hypothetical protein
MPDLHPEGVVIRTGHGGVTGCTTSVAVGSQAASHGSACVGWKKILACSISTVDEASDVAAQISHRNGGEVVNG